MTRSKSKQVRRDLVHAAGCVEPWCVAKVWLRESPPPTDTLEYFGLVLGSRHISVPRSLRVILGRWVGGSK